MAHFHLARRHMERRVVVSKPLDTSAMLAASSAALGASFGRIVRLRDNRLSRCNGGPREYGGNPRAPCGPPFLAKQSGPNDLLTYAPAFNIALGGLRCVDN